LVGRLAGVTAATPELLPKLKRAGVVDAGALGMFIFFEGYFKTLAESHSRDFPLVDFFRETLQVSPAFRETIESGYCIDTVIQIDPSAADRLSGISAMGDSVVVIPDADRLKVHFHAPDADAARERIKAVGDVLHWAADDLSLQTKGFRERGHTGAVHIMTDAAGSITRQAAHRLGITLLDSYVVTAEQALPETLLAAEEIYAAMRSGQRITTAQSSEFERHQIYRRVLSQYRRVLYLCVGSVYTGNYEVACAWKQKNDPEDRLAVIDTTAASGRLAVIVRSVASFAQSSRDVAAVIAFARDILSRCEEYIFLDRLKYLASGGRLSRKGAFMGDMLHLKPVISPTAQGARKVAAVHSREGQIQYALNRLRGASTPPVSGEILLQHSDNRDWVRDVVQPRIQAHCPGAEIRVHPLSLTSGVHMGPGTWAVAFRRDASRRA
jgi:DegV family protein with EDD domain